MKPDNNNILNRLKEILQTYAMEKPAPDYGRWIINPAPKKGSLILPKGTVKFVYSFPSSYMSLPFGGGTMIEQIPRNCQEPIDITKERNSPCCVDPTGTPPCQEMIVKVDREIPYKLPPLGPGIDPDSLPIWVSCVKGSSESREQIVCTTLEDIHLADRFQYTYPSR